MNRTKYIKLLSIFSVLIGVSTIFIVGVTAYSDTKTSNSSQSSEWLDATDESIFGTNALQKNSLENQSVRLQSVIDQANSRTQKIYIPSGVYIINNSVNLRSGIKIKGDIDNPTILKNETKKNVILSNENYQTSYNIEITQLFFEGVGIFTRVANDIVISDNVFYNPVSLYPVNLLTSNGAYVQNNIFMRDSDHSTPDTENRAVYIGGFATVGRYEYMENVIITDNLFGLRLNELNAIKSFSNQSIISTINRLQTALSSKQVKLNSNEQNYLSCGINSYNNAKNVLIKNNFFQQMYENENRFDVQGDHAIYLRGSQDIQVIGNHVRGLQNGSYGGFKFKSGRNITIMNNYIRNTGIIMYETPEFGLGDSFIRVPELSGWLVANNIFDFKEWQDKYGIGIVYNRHTGIDNVSNGVFIDNQYINYHNIPANRRRELLIMNREFEGFKGESTYVSGNTRDDTSDKVLDVEFWSEDEYKNMPKSWQTLIDPTIYDKYKNTKIPMRNSFPIGRKVEKILGESYNLFDFVDNTHDADEDKPEIDIKNPELLKKVGKHQVELVLSYKDGTEIIIFSEIVVVDSKQRDEIDQGVDGLRTTGGTINFQAGAQEIKVIPPNPELEIDIPASGVGATGPLSIVKTVEFNFGNQVISAKNQVYEMIAEMAYLKNGTGKVPYASFVQVQDSRGTNQGWDLKVSLDDFESILKDHILKGAQIEINDPYIRYEGNNPSNSPATQGNVLRLVPNTGSLSLMRANLGTGAGVSSLIFGEQSDLDSQLAHQEISKVKNKNILLFVPGKAEKIITTYKATLTWELSSIPGEKI